MELMGRQLCVAGRENLLWMRGGICQGEGRWELPDSVTCLVWAPKELDALQQVWEITRDWEENWSQWKMGRFLTLQTEAMETMAHGLFRRLTRLAKEYKVCEARVEGRGQAAEEGGLCWKGGQVS